MRRLLLTLLLIVAALAGCLGDPQDLDPASDETGAPGGPDGNRTGGRDGGNGTDGGEDDAGNGTDEPGGDEAGNGTDEGDGGNATGERGWPDPGEATVRPGVAVADGTCTANFVFRSPDNSTLYIGTAAHCFPDGKPGDPVSLADGAATGRLVYHSFRTMDRVNESSQGARQFNDFALVRIDPGFRGSVHPAVRAYGGPAGLAPGAEVGDRVLTVGETNLRDGASSLDPREGYVTGSSAWHLDVYLYAPSVPGDSGSPVLTADGRALGDLVTLEILPGAGSNDATKIGKAVAYMEAHGGPQVEIVTWPQFSDGRLPE